MFSLRWFISSAYYEASFLVCVFLIAHRMPRRKYFWLRACIGVVAFFLVMMASQAVLYTIGARGFSWSSLSRYLVYYVVVMLIVWFCFDCNFWTTVFCATVGYCLEHFGERLYELINRPLLGDVHIAWQYIIRTAVFAIAVVAIYFLLLRRSKYLRCNIMVDNKLQTAISAIVVGILVYVNSFAIAGAYGNLRVIFCINIMSLALSFMGIVLEAGIAENKGNANELAMVERLLQEERARYKLEKENIDLINMKYHDLKHMLESDIPASEKARLEGEISAYERTADTGNDALNVVLFRKNSYCSSHNINLSCLIDGKKLAFMSKYDLYSLFNNAIDNAIHSVMNLPDEKKIISITDTGGSNYVNIHIENYFAGEIKFVGNDPQTNGDQRFHGYGVKSMRYVTEKYGGVLNIRTSGDVFIVDIFLPEISKTAA